MEARREVEEVIGIEIAGHCAYLGLIWKEKGEFGEAGNHSQYRYLITKHLFMSHNRYLQLYNRICPASAAASRRSPPSWASCQS